MPRILPRLLDRIANQKDKDWQKSPFSLKREWPKSLFKQVHPPPSFLPSHYTKSIILSETNPISSSRVYRRHKTMPPHLRFQRRVNQLPGQYDSPREMSNLELQWWSNPYLRMLASPIRKCVVTDRYLPSDFLIRIGPMRMPPDLHTKSKNNNRESPEATLIPDGLQHPKFTARKAERAGYIVCNREAVPLLIERAAYRRVGRYTSVHALFAEHIVHLLRLRVLQELELLGDRMESLLGKPGAVYNSRLIRRLTRHEWKSIRATGVIPYPNAIAVLIVSPLNRDPVSKTRPKGSMSAAPLIEPEQPAPVNPPLPLSTLHPTTAHETVNDNTLPQARIPLYNGVPLFPARAQRAALYNLLIRLLDIERRSRHRTSPSPKMPEKVDDQDKKGSHAFLLCSDAEISRRADVAAVGIALWRVRMFEGGGWDDTSEGSNGWVNILTGS